MSRGASSVLRRVLGTRISRGSTYHGWVKSMTAWRKSSYSQTHGTSDCVELASVEGAVGIRDSKSLSTPHLTVSRDDIAALLARIKVGGLDL
ncbi:DUF397 domain-containing protein [Spirillospora sp. NPDC048819]|uniref:DUF397 domain-containing protein n=1 Tax=Spirillospora sp. NPDC048819 TaxID=3155268 RepID=UPI0033CD27F7